MIPEKERNAVSPWNQQSGLVFYYECGGSPHVLHLSLLSWGFFRVPREAGSGQSYSSLEMIIHSLVAENKGIYS